MSGQVITPTEDVANNSVTIKNTDALGNVLSAPDLRQYDVVELEVRDSKKNLIAKYSTSSTNNIPYLNGNNPIECRIDANDPSTNTNEVNKINFDIYGEDTADAKEGEIYANVFLVKFSVSRYPNNYDQIIPFLIFGKLTKPVS